MKRKAKGKSKASASRLRSKRIAKSKLRSKSARSSRKPTIKTQHRAATGKSNAKSSAERPSIGNKVVRIMGHGQFRIDSRTLKKLNVIDNTLVELVSRERSDDWEFRKGLAELNETVVKNGKPLDPHGIIKSDVILPSSDLSVDEAKKLFTGEGVIPEL
jgi:hypothetical protein